MSVEFLNWKGPQGRETIDQIDSGDFADWRARRSEKARLRDEYEMCGMAGYWSSRACANWKESA